MRNLTIILLLSVSSVALCFAQLSPPHLPLEKQQTTGLAYNYGVTYDHNQLMPNEWQQKISGEEAEQTYQILGQVMLLKASLLFITAIAISAPGMFRGSEFSGLALSSVSLMALNFVGSFISLVYDFGEYDSESPKSSSNYLLPALFLLDGLLHTGFGIYTAIKERAGASIFSTVLGGIGFGAAYVFYTIPL